MLSLYQRSGGREHLSAMRVAVLDREEYIVAIYDPLKAFLGFDNASSMTYSAFSDAFLKKYLRIEDTHRFTACIHAIDFTDKGFIEWDDVLIMAMWARKMFPDAIKSWHVSEFCDSLFHDYLLPVAKTYLPPAEWLTGMGRSSSWEVPWTLPIRTTWKKSFLAHELDKATRIRGGYTTMMGRVGQFSDVMGQNKD